MARFVEFGFAVAGIDSRFFEVSWGGRSVFAGYCRIGNLVKKNITQRQSASRYLKELTAIGVLRKVQAGKEKLFIHPKLMQLLADDRNAFTPYA